MRFAFSVLACLAITDFCHAEDWTVKDKVYHNVTVVEVRSNVVLVTYDGGTGQPWFSIGDLSPDLQKRLHYDPKKAEEVSKAEAQESAILLVEIELFSGGGPKSRYEKIQKERPAAVAEMEKHPITLVGTITYGSDFIYAVEADASTTTANSQALDGHGGRCYLLSKQPLKQGQKVTLTVYPTRSPLIDGKTYSCFSDDAGTAYDAAHTWGG